MRRYLALASALAIGGSWASAIFAQDFPPEPDARPRFEVLPARPGLEPNAAAASLTTWDGSFTYNGKTYSYAMVGTPPSTGATTTVTAVVIPLNVVVTNAGKQYSFNPAKVLPNGKTITQNTLDSPIFDFTTTYVQGGVDVGTTQYEDAFQRANFWGVVSTHPNYHVLLAPVLKPTQTLTVPANKGHLGRPFQGQNVVAEVDINWLDAQVTGLITKLGITADQFPIFLSEDVYLTSGGCCIGGYHSTLGGQTYTYATYVDQASFFSQDVSALSHEIGEWVDDPFTNNRVACGILEVGDPIEGNSNFGGYPYVLNGFTYNLQDLVLLPYFGASKRTSVRGFFTFQGENLKVCQNGG